MRSLQVLAPSGTQLSIRTEPASSLAAPSHCLNTVGVLGPSHFCPLWDSFNGMEPSLPQNSSLGLAETCSHLQRGLRLCLPIPASSPLCFRRCQIDPGAEVPAAGSPASPVLCRPAGTAVRELRISAGAWNSRRRRKGSSAGLQ